MMSFDRFWAQPWAPFTPLAVGALLLLVFGYSLGNTVAFLTMAILLIAVGAYLCMLANAPRRPPRRDWRH